MRIAVIVFNYRSENLRLMPWRYIHELTRHLVRIKQQVIVITDGADVLPKSDNVDNVPVIRLRHIKPFPPRNHDEIIKTITKVNPDIILWLMGLTSFFQRRLFEKLGYKIIALVGSPLYSLHELFKNLTITDILQNTRLIMANLAEAVIPRRLIRNTFNLSIIKKIVTMSRRNMDRLKQIGVPSEKIICIPPGIDVSFLEIPSVQEIKKTKSELCKDFNTCFLITYFGPPLSIRGIDTLLLAVKHAFKKGLMLSEVRVLILSREREQLYRLQERNLERLIRRLDLSSVVEIKHGLLNEDMIKAYLAASDLVVLPFKHVISDAPISILESMSLGVPVLSTDVDGIPELLENKKGLLIIPGDFKNLAELVAYFHRKLEKLKEYGRRARKYALSQPTWQESASRMLEILKESQLTVSEPSVNKAGC